MNKRFGKHVENKLERKCTH